MQARSRPPARARPGPRPPPRPEVTPAARPNEIWRDLALERGAGSRRPSAEASAVRSEILAHPGGGLGVQLPLTPGLLAWAVAARQGELPEDGGAMPPPADDHPNARQAEITGELFVSEEGAACRERPERCIEANDTLQGALADCYLIAILAAIARVRPEFIRQMIRDNGDGTYTVTLYRFPTGAERPQHLRVTVDDVFYVRRTGAPLYAGFGDRGAPAEEGGRPQVREIWPMIIERAYAQLHGGYENIEFPNVRPAWQELTGQPADVVALPGGATNEQLRERIARHFGERRLPAIFSSLGHDKDEVLEGSGPRGQRVRGNHAYALEEYHPGDAATATVDLYNPWREQHLRGKTMAYLRRYFLRARFLHVQPQVGAQAGVGP